MPAEPRTDDTTDHVLGEGVALALKAEDSGDWKPVAKWLAQNPDRGQDFAKFLADHGEILDVLRPPPTPERTGSIVSGLELKEEIGRGAMGVVYRASDLILKRDVAVKMVRTGDEMTSAELARFRFEATVVASLDHPNIVRVLSCETTPNGEPYLVMPLMTGGSLSAWLKNRGPDRRLPEMLAAEIVRDIALGVHHAHQRGLIHRDIKPANILLDESRRPHVADFGLARPADAIATSEAGTPMYMAPEQARGEKHLTTAVDIHALGVMLFEFLTAQTPYGGDIGSIFRQLTDPTVVAPAVRRLRPDISTDIEAVCMKCLEKDPSKRYLSALGLANDLTRFLNGDAVSAQLPGFWDWLRQLSRTRPEPHLDYSWQVTIWFGFLILTTNASIFVMAQTDTAAAWVWVANFVCGATMSVVLWWYMLRRFRQLPTTERHSLIIAAGNILTYLVLTIAYVPLSFSIPAEQSLGLYPGLTVASGLGLFTLGSTNWSRFFLIGLAVMLLTPITAWWPHSSPLVYGGVIAIVMWYWTVTKALHFVIKGKLPEEQKKV
ncbi:MAG: serine/threonine protein kinase [Planctomycetes bacterium]|nr:serine/threonine protein kinase [Planctomycetota bacterium]